MRGVLTPFVAGLAAILAAGGAPPAAAESISVRPGEPVQAAIDRAVPGDTVVLLRGEHRGKVHIDRAITLAGEGGATLAGTGEGSVVTVQAAGAVVRRLTITGSGRDLQSMDSGVFVARGATDAVVEDNRIEGNLFGIYLHGAQNAVARRNVVIGLTTARMSERGNGISLWNAPGATVVDNDVRFGRDGIFVITSRNNLISANRFRDLRFAVHYMYGNDGEISGNLSIGNTIGYALMFSRRLKVRANLSEQDRDHGLLLNYANGADIAGNIFIGGVLPIARWASAGGGDTQHQALTRDRATAGAARRTAPEKCVFIYNANANRLHDNWFEGCEIGVHFTAGSERNEIFGNAFVRNRNQVKYVGTRFLDWSVRGRGNYWSDNPAFDLNGDGIADTAYRPNDLVDKALWAAPPAKVLINSPAIEMIRWAQAQFPALLPGGVVDSRPLIAPPPKPAVRFGDGS